MPSLRRRYLAAMGLPLATAACAANEPASTEVTLPPLPPRASAPSSPRGPIHRGQRWIASYEESLGPECEDVTGEARCAFRDDITGAASCPASLDELAHSLPLARTPSTQETVLRGQVVCCYGKPLSCVTVQRYRGRAFDAVATSVVREDWVGIAAPDGSGIDWAAMAAAEHAAIASFARTTLELMALGAPPELLRETQRAALDEIEHARFAYAMASHGGTRAVGPGPLAAAALPVAPPSFAAFACATFRDACVAETLGAIAVRRDAERASPELRARLLAIAEDEERHAELAWRTLAWAVRAGGPAARDALRGALERVDAEADAMADVVVPCAHALLSA